jgi:hypothetical protein
MAKESKRKLLHYRRATFLRPVGRTLQDLVEEAMRKRPLVKDRLRTIEDGTEDGWQQFVNTHRSVLGMEFGNLVLYAPGQNRQIIALDDQANELDIEQLSPPEGEDGKKRQFLESLLYYGFAENHILLLQSVALRARELESYLNFLLWDAGLLAEDNAVYLNNYAPAATHERLSRAEVKSVRVGTPLVDVAAMGEDAQDSGLPGRSARLTRRSAFSPIGEGLDLLQQLMGERLRGIDWSDLHTGNNLQVFVEVTYSRQTDEKSQRMLNNLTSALRHVSDDDVRIELKGGGTVVGSELQVKSYKNIDTYGGIVDPQDLFEKMSAWLIEILNQGLIDAE